MKTKLVHLTIRQAESMKDLERLYHFRYRVYVEEMGRPQRYADHARPRIGEPLDATAARFIAVEDGDLKSQATHPYYLHPNMALDMNHCFVL